MPVTINKGLSVQTSGSNPGMWGAGSSEALNEGVFEPLDDILGGLNTVALTSSNVDLTQAQGWRLIQRLTGALLANVTVTSPNIGFNLIENATTGNFTVTWRFTGGVGGTVVVPQGTRALVFADATNGVRFATQALANEALILSRSANDTNEYEVLSLRSGNGSGNKGSDRIVGSGSNAVAERRRYIGSTEIERLTTSLALMNILFGVGGSIRLSPSGFLDLTEIAAPANPSANVARFGVVDEGGTTNATWRDSAGVVSGLRVASAAEMEAATSLLRHVPPGRQHFHPGHPKAWGRAAGDGTLVSGSYNVASVVRNSTGNYTVALTNAMANTNYVAKADVAEATNNRSAAAAVATTSTFTVITSQNTTGNLIDAAFSFEVFGDMP
jgi:hypothetical protein